jgi:hypothetical protein
MGVIKPCGDKRHNFQISTRTSGGKSMSFAIVDEGRAIICEAARESGSKTQIYQVYP